MLRKLISPNAAEVHDYLRGRNIARRQEDWERLAPASNPLEWTASVIGGITGIMKSPESYFFPAKSVARLASPVSRIGAAGAWGAGINVGIDYPVQQLRMSVGLQEHYEPGRTAAAAALGLFLPAGIQAGIERYGRAVVADGFNPFFDFTPVPISISEGATVPVGRLLPTTRGRADVQFNLSEAQLRAEAVARADVAFNRIVDGGKTHALRSTLQRIRDSEFVSDAGEG